MNLEYFCPSGAVNPNPRGWRGGMAETLRRAEEHGYECGKAGVDPDGTQLGSDDDRYEIPAKIVTAYRRGWRSGYRVRPPSVQGPIGPRP